MASIWPIAAARPSSIPISIICSIASRDGKRDSMSMRVAPLGNSLKMTVNCPELVEQAADVAHSVDPAAHDPLAASLVLGDELGPLEDGDVLLHGGEAHRVTPGQRGYVVLAAQHQPDDVSACRIGERVEQQVGPLHRRWAVTEAPREPTFRPDERALTYKSALHGGKFGR